MPDVVIRGMKMPPSCAECRLRGDTLCYAVEETWAQPEGLDSGGRPDWCPLGFQFSQADYSRERYRMFRNQGKCANCGKSDARTESGKAMCQRCADRQNESNQARREYMRIVRSSRTKRGLCITCGAKLPDAQYKNCPVCRKKNRDKYRIERGLPLE